MEQEKKSTIRQLENKRANAINSSKLISLKREKINKYLLINIAASFIAYIIGIITLLPILTFIATMYNCLNVVAIGPIILYFETKESKLEKEIVLCDEEIKNLEAQLNNTSSLEALPQTTQIINKTQSVTNKKTKTNKQKKL